MRFDREFFSYFAVSCVVILLVAFRWTRRYLPQWYLVAALVLGVAVAFAFAVSMRRADDVEAKRRATLRAEGKSEQPTVRHADSFYALLLAQGGGYLMVGLLLFIAGIALLEPALLFGGILLAGWHGARVWNYWQWWEEEKEHRRTSLERVESASEGLSRSNWERAQHDSTIKPD